MDFYKTLKHLSAQFYSIDMIKNFPNVLMGHQKEDEHDPRHDGQEFHEHVIGIPPEIAKYHILVF